MVVQSKIKLPAIQGGKRWLGALISLLFILLLVYKFSDIGFHRLWQCLLQVQPLFFIAGIFLMVVSAFMQACRWHIILLPLGKFPLWQTFASVTIGHWFNAVLPVRIGELARPYHFSRKHNIPFATILATNVIERVFDLLLVFALAAVCFALLNVWTDVRYLIGFFVMFAGTLVLLFLITQNRINLKLEKWVFDEKIGTRIKAFYEQFIAGAKLLKSFSQFAGVLFFTTCEWVANLLAYWLLISSCNLPAVLKSISSGALVTLFGTTAHAVPSTASGLGVVNYGVVFALEQYAGAISFDITHHADAIAATSIVVYVAAIIPDVLVGGFFYWKDRALFTGFDETKIKG